MSIKSESGKKHPSLISPSKHTTHEIKRQQIYFAVFFFFLRPVGLQQQSDSYLLLERQAVLYCLTLKQVSIQLNIKIDLFKATVTQAKRATADH